MNTSTILRAALAGVLAFSSAAALAGTAKVSFDHPEDFVEMPWMQADKDDILKDLSDHFAALAKKLPPGEELTVEVKDFNMAGRIRPGRFTGHEIRILRGGADWPRMDLHYTLTRNGMVVASGDAHLSNMDYLQRINIYDSGDSLRYEKQMMDDWFKKEILRR
jgi:hypothetical protein